MKQCPEQMSLFSAEASLDHASHFPSPGNDEARRMTVTSGRKCCALLKSCSPVLLLVKMLLESSVWRSTRCLLTWKPQGTKQGRLLFRLAPSTPRTGETGVRSWPTPRANAGTGPSHSPGRQGAPDLQTAIGGLLNPDWVEWLMGFPAGWTEV